MADLLEHLTGAAGKIEEAIAWLHDAERDLNRALDCMVDTRPGQDLPPDQYPPVPDCPLSRNIEAALHNVCVTQLAAAGAMLPLAADIKAMNDHEREGE